VTERPTSAFLEALQAFHDALVELGAPFTFIGVAFRPRDIDDAEKLLNLHHGEIQIARVRRLVQQFCEALEDTARLETLDRLLKRLGLLPPN